MDNTAEVMELGNTTFEIQSFYDNEMPLMELLMNALRRDAQAVLRHISDPVHGDETS